MGDLFGCSIPNNVVMGGYEGNTRLPMCRCTYNGANHPGKVVGGNCNIGWGGEKIVMKYFDILVNTGSNTNLIIK